MEKATKKSTPLSHMFITQIAMQKENVEKILRNEKKHP